MRDAAAVAVGWMLAYMQRALPHGLELDDDPTRVDVAAVHAFRRRAIGRRVAPRASGSASCVRPPVSSGSTTPPVRSVSRGSSPTESLPPSWADVYVLPEWRGRGLGCELVRETVYRSIKARTATCVGHYMSSTAMASTRGLAFSLHQPPSDRLLVREPER